MTFTALQFAREFELLKSRLLDEVEPDNRVVTLVEFWPTLKPRFVQPVYVTYVDEYVHLFIDAISKITACDLVSREFVGVKTVCAELGRSSPAGSVSSQLSQISAQVNHWHAAGLLFVGAIPEALSALGLSEGDLQSMARIDRKEGLSPLELAIELSQRHDLSDEVALYLHRLVNEWQDANERTHFDRVKCLFVEQYGQNRGRGRLREISGNARFLKESSTDEITLDNRLVSSDDPTIGALYHATDAVRHYLRNSGGTGEIEHVHVHLSVDHTRQLITGDSMGVATALLLYVQLMKPSIRRIECAIAGDIAVIGAIDIDGSIRAVNHESIASKVARAFFSPINSLVVPEDNIEVAHQATAKLQAHFPNRKLHLIAASHLSELIRDRNVVREERVCIGQYAGRKAAQLTRATKVQVPMLIALLYVLLCLVYPKAFPWFDRHIAQVEILKDRVRTFNNDGHLLWVSPPFQSGLDSLKYGAEGLHYWATDADQDGKDELFFVNKGLRTESYLNYFDDDGALMWSHATFVRTTYPGDTRYPGWPESFFYNPPDLLPISTHDGHQYLLTESAASNPWRNQIMLFDRYGLVSGPYLSSGAGSLAGSVPRDINLDGRIDVITSGVDNRSRRYVILALNPFELSGANPPYDEECFKLSGMPKGSQLRYVSLPRTPLSAGPEVKSVLTEPLSYDLGKKSMLAVIGEGHSSVISGVRFETPKMLPHLYWHLDSNFIPYDLIFEDGTREQINQLLVLTNRPPIRDFVRLRDSLLNEVIVYHGDSLVHHPAKGVYFYARAGY